MPKALITLIVAAIALSGCAHFTKSGRQQLAYQKYVRKQSGIRTRQQAKMRPRRVRLPTMMPSQPKVTTTVSESPQSVTSAESEGNE